ncbi:MAG: IS30 family transposase [Amylibacter sp.]|nr:IS30 family transposase [Amylibacter sp.]
MRLLIVAWYILYSVATDVLFCCFNRKNKWLKTGWSPEQIAGRLKTESNAPLGISHETIYQFVYSKDGQKDELGKLLPERRKKCRSRYARKARGVNFPDAVSIKNRPDTINQREEFGHWEGDLMIFQRDQVRPM